MSSHNRQRHVGRNIVILVGLLLLLLGFYFKLRADELGKTVEWRKVFSFLQKNPDAQYSISQSVIQTGDGRIGKVLDSSIDYNNGQKEVIYTVQYDDEQKEEVFERFLGIVEVPFSIGQEIELANPDYYGESSAGAINSISQEVIDGVPVFYYTATFPTIGRLEQLTSQDLIWNSTITLSEKNSGKDNQKIIQETLNKTTDFGYSRLTFSSGSYLIGSDTPEEDYIRLTSNTELIGNDTTLIVDGTTYWLGFATGPNATDGLANFAMYGLNFIAKDLKKGAEFKLMANHGYNWEIRNNRFTLVHALSSHLFDLGGVQYALFENNIFEGYAPEMTKVTEIGDREHHNFYAEAIQLDASSDNGVWDGGLFQKLDPNYMNNNSAQVLSHYITITNNQFIPYYDENNQIVAYGASVGQHSSDVGVVSLYNNYLKSTLSARFIDQADSASKWLFEPIHFLKSSDNYAYSNVIE